MPYLRPTVNQLSPLRAPREPRTLPESSAGARDAPAVAHRLAAGRPQARSMSK